MTQIKLTQVDIGSFVLTLRCDGKKFCLALQIACPSSKMIAKIPRQIHYVSYCKHSLEDTFKHCNYLGQELSYIRSLVPNDVKDEILKDWYKVPLKEA